MFIVGKPFQLTFFKTVSGKTLVSCQIRTRESELYKFNIGTLENCLPDDYRGHIFDVIDAHELRVMCDAEAAGKFYFNLFSNKKNFKFLREQSLPAENWFKS